MRNQPTPVLARPGMAATLYIKGDSSGGSDGRECVIEHVLTEMCIGRDADGKLVVSEWKDVELRSVTPDPEYTLDNKDPVRGARALFRDVDGRPVPVLEEDPSGAARTPDGVELFSLEQAAAWFNMARDALRATFDAFFKDLIPDDEPAA